MTKAARVALSRAEEIIDRLAFNDRNVCDWSPNRINVRGKTDPEVAAAVETLGLDVAARRYAAQRKAHG